jgi:hypothetical protein
MSESSFSSRPLWYALALWLVLSLFSLAEAAEVQVPDSLAPVGSPVMLEAHTKGMFFARGGEEVTFYVDGKRLGETLSGADGIAYMEFVPRRAGLHTVKTASGEAEGAGLLLVLERGARIVLVHVEGALFKGPLTKEPRRGSVEAVKKISEAFPVLYVTALPLGRGALREWLRENGFPEAPLLDWKAGGLPGWIKKKGFAVRAVIGDPEVAAGAAEQGLHAFSFEQAEGARKVRSWKEVAEDPAFRPKKQ